MNTTSLKKQLQQIKTQVQEQAKEDEKPIIRVCGIDPVTKQETGGFIIDLANPANNRAFGDCLNPFRDCPE